MEPDRKLVFYQVRDTRYNKTVAPEHIRADVKFTPTPAVTASPFSSHLQAQVGVVRLHELDGVGPVPARHKLEEPVQQSRRPGVGIHLGEFPHGVHILRIQRGSGTERGFNLTMEAGLTGILRSIYIYVYMQGKNRTGEGRGKTTLCFVTPDVSSDYYGGPQ